MLNNSNASHEAVSKFLKVILLVFLIYILASSLFIVAKGWHRIDLYILGASAGDFYQAVSTLITGLVAMWAGWQAYKSALVERDKDDSEYKQRVLAYKLRLAYVVEVIMIRVSATKDGLNEEINFPVQKLPQIHVSNALEESDWENHALLEKSLIRKIHNLRISINYYNKFLSECNKNINDEFSEGATCLYHLNIMLNSISDECILINNKLNIDIEAVIT